MIQHTHAITEIYMLVPACVFYPTSLLENISLYYRERQES